MRSLVLLLSVFCVSVYSDTVEEVSWDSSDEDQSNSFDGLAVTVLLEDGMPVITLSTDLNDHEDTYCFNFLGVFESSSYDIDTESDSYGDYEIVDGTEYDFGDSNDFDVVESDTDRAFTITGTVGDATLILDFVFTETDDGDYGVKYTVNLEDYAFVDVTNQLVFMVSIFDCSDEHGYDSDSDDDSEDDDDDDSDDLESTLFPDDSSETTTGLPRRRLFSGTEDDDDTNSEDDVDSEDGDDDDDSDSLDESAGISSDDSNEFDTGLAEFISDEPAYDLCVDDSDNEISKTEINSYLVFQKDEGDDGVLHLVYDYFVCDLFQDPFAGIDSSKATTSNANSLSIIIAITAATICAVLSF
eukprot:350072_1